MTFIQFLEDLRQKDIKVSFSGGKIKYSGPEEFITPDFIMNLKRFKGKLIKHLWPAEWHNFMPINTEGSKIPLFIVHGDNGNYMISEFLGPDQPVYGFFHPGSQGEGVPYSNTEEMAKAYLQMIQAVHPNGPYLLAGYSYGGVLAYEIAIQLRDSGQQVPVLIMLDSVCPITKRIIHWEDGFFRKIRKNILGPCRRFFENSIDYLWCNFYLLRKENIPPSRRTFYLRMKYSRLMKNYKPRKFDGNLLLFRATGNTFSYRSLGWQSLVHQVQTIEYDGKHLDIFSDKDKLQPLFSEIARYLNNVAV